VGIRTSTLFFWISLILTLLHPHIFSKPLLSFAPYLVFISLQQSGESTLWKSSFCGIIVDLLSTSLPFGFNILSFVLISLILKKFKSFLVKDSLLSEMIFIALFSLIYSFFLQTWYGFEKKALIFSARSIFTDYFLMPAFDAMMALCFFFGPRFAINLFRKKALHKI
jgi:cell shape-determining protein MreD